MSWNILHGGGRRLSDISSLVEGHAPDILVLQEFRRSTMESRLIEDLSQIGLAPLNKPAFPDAKLNNLMIFTSEDLECEVLHCDAKGAQRIMRVTSPMGFEIVGVSFPHKREQLALFDILDELAPVGKCLILGDFNCGIPFEDSQTKSFENAHRFIALQQKGWIDVWRNRNKQAREYTWFSTQKGNGFRYDHALASPELDAAISSIAYDHQAREDGLSDHSALLLDFSN